MSAYSKRARKQENEKFIEVCREEQENSGTPAEESSNRLFAEKLDEMMNQYDDLDVHRQDENLMIVQVLGEEE